MDTTRSIHCPECKYYFPPVCTFHRWLPMVSRKGYCYHARKGKYEGGTPVIETENVNKEPGRVPVDMVPAGNGGPMKIKASTAVEELNKMAAVTNDSYKLASLQLGMEAINEAEANKEKQKVLEEVKEEMCDHYCRFPNVAPNEWELWQICASCPMDRL